MVPRSLFASLASVWLLPGMVWYESACTTMIMVRFATSRANSALHSSMPLVRRLPRLMRPSTLLECRLEVVPLSISVPTPVASSPARSRKPTMMKLPKSEEPPWLMKGRVRPVSGMRRVTPPTMMNACSTIMPVRPTATKLDTSDFARAAVRKPRMAKHRNSSSTPAAPRRPISSAMSAKMKSLSTTGMALNASVPPARPLPRPTPNRSPSAME